jgi:benzoyl-CoA reductase subunit C
MEQKKVELENLIESCREIAEVKSYNCISHYKNTVPAKKAVGYFPVYTPYELINSFGILPVAITGAGNKHEIAHADSKFGSFICSIVKSTTELAIIGELDALDGMVFQSICDAARNLAFIFKRNFSNKFYTEYLHLPHNSSSTESINFLHTELKRFASVLEQISKREYSRESLFESIQDYNENRRLLRQLHSIKSAKPHLLSICELYLLTKVGNFMPVVEHNKILRDILSKLDSRNLRPRDGIRVVIEGSFCEQPPMDLVQVFDQVGCYVVDDDFLLGRKWYLEDIPLNSSDPLLSLAESYVNRTTYSSVKHDWRKPRHERLIEKVRVSNAHAVIFCIAKFCEPAFFDFPIFKRELDKANIPFVELEFEEKQYVFEKQKSELETFVESILFD